MYSAYKFFVCPLTMCCCSVVPSVVSVVFHYLVGYESLVCSSCSSIIVCWSCVTEVLVMFPLMRVYWSCSSSILLMHPHVLLVIHASCIPACKCTQHLSNHCRSLVLVFTSNRRYMPNIYIYIYQYAPVRMHVSRCVIAAFSIALALPPPSDVPVVSRDRTFYL